MFRWTAFGLLFGEQIARAAADGCHIDGTVCGADEPQVLLLQKSISAHEEPAGANDVCPDTKKPLSLSSEFLALLPTTLTLMDPVGAPCTNCDCDGMYRFPGRENCNVVTNERKMVQGAVEGLAKNPYDFELVDEATRFSLMGLVCSDYLIEQGGLDAILGVIKSSDAMPADWSEEKKIWFEFRGWQALMEQSGSPKAAPLIANHGGPNKVIELAVERLKAHHAPTELKARGPSDHWVSDYLTLRYQIGINIAHLLGYDLTGEWKAAFVRAGGLDEMLHTMRAESDRCSAMFASCWTLNSVLYPQSAAAIGYRDELLQKGAADLVQEAWQGCTPYKPALTETKEYMYYSTYHTADKACGYLSGLLKGA